MKKRQKNIAKYLLPLIAFAALFLLWQGIAMSGLVPNFMLPSPVQVAQALVGDFWLLMDNAKVTLTEALSGLGIGVALGFIIAVLMERFNWVYHCSYPFLIISQTIPSVAIAPLLVLWMGYGMAPKVALVVIMTFFPISIGLLNGFRSVDPQSIALLRTMGAGQWQVFRHAKLPVGISGFFGGLKISAAYAIVGAVIAEWLGGYSGLGVYMTRVRKSYSYDKMFAVIIVISVLSLLLVGLVTLFQKRALSWQKEEKR